MNDNIAKTPQNVLSCLLDKQTTDDVTLKFFPDIILLPRISGSLCQMGIKFTEQAHRNWSSWSAIH